MKNKIFIDNIKMYNKKYSLEEQMSSFKLQLMKILENYNSFISKINFNIAQDAHTIISNGNKYYLFLYNKKLFFFNTMNNFFLNTTYDCRDTILLEGYLYECDNEKHYLISDILYINKILTEQYVERHNYIHKIINKYFSKENLNINISIHPYINSNDKNLINIFINNFKFKSQLTSIENINFLNKVKIESIKPESKSKKLKIVKTNFPDVYKIYDIITGINMGILYIKTMKDSYELSNLFKDSSENILECTFNNNFNKWQYISK